MTNDASEPMRPRDFALLLLASRDLRPRQRARDQQADRAGLELKRHLLEEVAAIDPDPGELDVELMRIAGRLGEPSGPPRAIAAIVREEWAMACTSPEWVSQLLAEALESPEAAKKERRRG
jgi:hypothetical protein